MISSSVKISVVLPAFNAERTIFESIKSIINQTYKDWELLIIDDGSSDSTVNIVRQFTDERIFIFQNGCNKGLIFSLNRGIKEAKGKYIVRLDSDDIAEPNRFEVQERYMENNPDVIVCGSFMKTFGIKTKSKIISFYENDEDIKKFFLMNPPFGHPSVIIRKNILDKTNIKYDYDFKCAEDMKLWLDLIPYGKFANINQCLTNYRISDFQCTQNTNFTMIQNVQKCRRLYLMQNQTPEIWSKFEKEGVTISIIKKVKASKRSDMVHAMYQSMRKFDIVIFFYYLLSGDFLNDTQINRKNVFKRFIGRSISVL